MVFSPRSHIAKHSSYVIRGIFPQILSLVGELLGSPSQCRHLSTQPSSPSFKAQTRALLKLIHPDQFQQHPEAREANERSFKLLQEYLAAAKTGGGIGRTAGLPYHFTFYIHSRQSPGSDGEQEEAEDDGLSSRRGETEPLKRVSLTLPPPVCSVHPESAEIHPAPPPAQLHESEYRLQLIKTGPGDDPSPSTRQAFSRLLNACGISDTGSLESLQGLRTYSRVTSLREFVPQAAEQIHQAAAQAAGPRQQLGAVRTALRLGRNVVVTWGEPLASGGPLPQLEAARQLLTVLDGLPELDVAGLRFSVGDAYGVDALGTIWLHAGDSALAWTRYISQVDTAYCRERLLLLQRVRAQEAAVARALRVHLVYTHPQLSLDPPYLAFLEGVAAAAAELGPAGQGALGDVPLMVHCDAAQGLDADMAPIKGKESGGGGTARGGAEGWRPGVGDPHLAPWLDEATGVVCVPASIPPQALYGTLRTLGPQAQAVLREARDGEAQAAQLRKAVERKLRLRSLGAAPGLPPAQFRAACLRLMHHSGALTPLLEGLAVRVGEVNALAPDRSYLEVPWDFVV